MNTAEEAILFAVLDDNQDEAMRLLRDSLPGELNALENACDKVVDLIREVRIQRRRDAV